MTLAPSGYADSMDHHGTVPLEAGDLDLTLGVLRGPDGTHQLTLHQLDLLRYLVARPGMPVAREELLKEAWGWRGKVLRTRATDFAIMRIRAAIEKDPASPRHLITHPGVGYRFEPLKPTAALPPPSALQPPGARFDAGWYVARPPEERRAAEYLAYPGAPVVFTAPRGFGKTWLLQKVLGDTVLADDVGVEVNLESWDASTLVSTEAVAYHLALALADAADVPEEALATAWASPGDPFRRVTRFLERDVLPTVAGRLVLVIDHADLFRHVPEGASIFGLLRSWASRPRAPWERLRLVLAVSTEPALLVDQPQLSPFNLSIPIALSPLDAGQVAELARRHELPAATVVPVLSLTGGHPTLVRLALHGAATGADPALEPGEDGGIYASHLENRARRLRARPELAAAVRALDAGLIPEADAAERLVSAGVFRRTGSGYALQNRLYERFLPRWLG